MTRQRIRRGHVRRQCLAISTGLAPPRQDVRGQRLAILREYARANDVRIDEFILQRGDRLAVSELSRLGRSLGQIVTILDALAQAGVPFVALKENIRLEVTKPATRQTSQRISGRRRRPSRHRRVRAS